MIQRIIRMVFARFTAFDPHLLEWARDQEDAAKRSVREPQPENLVVQSILGTRKRREDR